MGDIDNVEFTEDAIIFHDYPYPGASVHPSGEILWSDVLEIDPDEAPPQVRIKGETLFISAMRKNDLIAEAERHGVPAVARNDLWFWILLPCLGETSDHTLEWTMGNLERNGFTRAEVEELRQRVGWPVKAFCAMIDAWIYVGMHDLLDAHRSNPATAAWARFMTDDLFREIYQLAQKVNARAFVRPPLPSPNGEPAAGPRGG